MRNKTRVYDRDSGCYGTVLLQDFKDDKLAEIVVEFHRDRSTKKGDTPRYELFDIRVVKKSNLK
jgi:hypothetical protein